MGSDASLSVELVLQYIAVGIVLVVCLWWIYRRWRHRNDASCDDADEGCEGCILSRTCKKKDGTTEK